MPFHTLWCKPESLQWQSRAAHSDQTTYLALLAQHTWACTTLRTAGRLLSLAHKKSHMGQCPNRWIACERTLRTGLLALLLGTRTLGTTGLATNGAIGRLHDVPAAVSASFLQRAVANERSPARRPVLGVGLKENPAAACSFPFCFRTMFLLLMLLLHCFRAVLQ